MEREREPAARGRKAAAAIMVFELQRARRMNKHARSLVIGDLSIALWPSLLYFTAMHFRANGWTSGGVLTPDAAPSYWKAIVAAGGRDLLAEDRGTTVAIVGAVLLTLSFASMVLAYVHLVRRSLGSGTPLGLRSILVATTIVGLPLVLAPFLLSGDTYSYVIYGRIYAVHGGNPYTDRPDLYGEDPFLPLVYWNDAKMIYGPIWLYPTAGLTWVLARIGAGAGLHVLAFKIFLFGCHLGATALVHAIARRLRPAHAATAALAYALNPLCLVEFAGNAHIDAFVILLLLAGIYAHVRGRPVAAFLLLLAAALTKPQMIVLAGFYGLGHVRSSPSVRVAARRAFGLCALALAFAAVSYAPVWAGPATFDEVVHGPASHRYLNSIAEWLVAKGLPQGTIRILLAGAFIATVGALALRVRSTADAVRTFPWFAIAFCVLASTWFWPWYTAFGLALALAAGSRTAIIAATLLSTTALAIYVTFAFGSPQLPMLRHVVELVHRSRSLLVFSPVIVAMVWLAWRERRIACTGLDARRTI
jgi:hypothetical protein